MKIFPHPPIWTERLGLAELFKNFFPSLCNGNERADFTKVSQIFFPHYPLEVTCGFEQRFGEFSFHIHGRNVNPFTTRWRSDSGLTESLGNFLLTGRSREKPKLTPSTENFCSQYPLEVGCHSGPLFAEISSSAFPLERKLEFERIIFPLPISENPGRIEPPNWQIFIPLSISKKEGDLKPLNAKNPHAISGTGKNR